MMLLVLPIHLLTVVIMSQTKMFNPPVNV